MRELPDHILNIPRAIAAKRASPGTDAYEELVSDGNLALMQAVASYDPDKGTALSSWIYTYVNLALKRRTRRTRKNGEAVSDHDSRWARLSSLDEVTEATGFTPADDSRPDAPVINGEALAHALAGLPPLDRAAYILWHRDGKTKAEIAELLGCSFGHVKCIVLPRVEARVKRRVARIGVCAGGNPNPSPPRTQAQREASSRYRKECAVAARLLGDLPKRRNCWYLVCDVTRTIEGPGTVKALLTRHGVSGQTRGGRGLTRIMTDPRLGGRRLVRGPEAPFLFKDGYRLQD